MTAEPLLAGVELGGTKSIALVARGRTILARERVATGAPDETLAALAAALGRLVAAHGPPAALGVASFGPIGVDALEPSHGVIGRTPKPGWAGVDVLTPLATALGDPPSAIDTDVNGAALAEGEWGASRGATVHAYLTVGTGIGGGLVVGGRAVHGAAHPEMGHVHVRRDPEDGFSGVCPFHGDCLEGLASGPAIAARAGAPAETLSPGHPVWTNVAAELSELLATIILVASPQKIALGGGVMGGAPHLFPRLRAGVARALGGYVAGLDAPTLDALIVPPLLGDDAGPLGAIMVARSAAP
jgi:fructokinase